MVGPAILLAVRSRVAQATQVVALPVAMSVPVAVPVAVAVPGG